MTDVNANLIERLEKATGPDRESDFLIFEATAFPKDYFGSKIESWSRAGGAGYTVNTADGIRHLSAFNAPHYTGSLDAARQLAREFYWVASEGKTRDSEPLGGAQVFRRDYLVTPVAEAEHEKVEIALCIAALKARATNPT